MKRNTYDPQTKAAILAAATEARAAGKPWSVAFSAAREAGYKGSLQGITHLLMNAKKPAGKRGRKPGPKAAVKVTSGRPLKVAAGTDSIEAMVDKLVRERVSSILNKAIATLEELR
jgi:hypothetical protein